MAQRNPLDMDVVARLYAQGKSLREIGLLVGAGFKTVQRHMAAAGIERRPPACNGINEATRAGLAAWHERRAIEGFPRTGPKACIRPPVPCDVCGTPTASRLRICKRSVACIAAYQAAYWITYQPADRATRVPCAVCGSGTISDLGVCTRTRECRVEYGRRFRSSASA